MNQQEALRRLEVLEAKAREADIKPTLMALEAESGIPAEEILAESRRIHTAIEGMSRFEAEDWLTQDLMRATTLNEVEALAIVRSWGVV